MADAKIFAYDYDQHDYPNGLRLITVPAPYPQVVSLYIVVQAGSRNEVEEGRSGFAHFFEHMMFRGTPAFPPERYEAVLQETGASSNAYTDDDRTVYHTTLTKEDFETLLAMEADRFQHLDYPLEGFQTEALAVLGEYNKDSTEPINKLMEVLRDTAFDAHTYKHTTMGFLRDIERMPQMYDYSRTFFDRFYRPEYTTLIVAGDVDPAEVRAQVERHWGAWQRGSYICAPAVEPAQSSPREAHIPWPTHTLPYLLVAHHSPAYSDEITDGAALDIISFLGFSESSPLYEKLVIEDQSVDLLWASNADHVDPYLFTVMARVKEDPMVPDVRESILATLRGFAETPVDDSLLANVKSHLRYRFALSLDNSEAIASTLAHYVSLRRTPETINRLFYLYEQVTPQLLQTVAARFFQPNGRTIVTLANGDAK
ncbi:M16 family metallopeptidase [Paludibaculum fermentans]|uniref:Insulinase family protein n=1 Tax=Paludibaculum fermentans TaxID=1473598 RepID=A0A7S7NSS8_PALFE|nr:pitrilysin family protein [Paludibaculum fermentans]QOY89163.1 insulinase family protein [Paludibaculum fermentans]